jgi:hypothetical protein
MGNQASKPPEYSEEVLASLTPRGRSKLNQMVHHNFFEPASITNDPSKFNKSLPRSSSGQSTTNHNKEKRKWSSSSEESDNSYLITPATASPLSGSTVYSSNVKTNFEVLNGRRYLSSPGSHFFLPCDDEEADRLVILVKKK